MRLNGNQISALYQLYMEDKYFHFDLLGTDVLDKRIVCIKAWNFDYTALKQVTVDENGTVISLDGKLIHERT